MGAGEQMPRSRYCRCCKDFHDLDQAWPQACAGHFGQRGEDAGFYIQSDTVDGFRSMADGKMYNSKSKYRAELKARGMVELGNDQIRSRPTPLPPVRETLRQTLQQLNGRA
jgi:hypothetical protein